MQSCFNNPHENIGVRILKRAAERRKDFGRFYMAVSAEQREQIADTIKVLLKKSVAGIHNADEEVGAVHFACFFFNAVHDELNFLDWILDF